MGDFWKKLFRLDAPKTPYGEGEKGFDIARDGRLGAAPQDLSGLFGNKKANSAVSAASRFIRLTLPEAPFLIWNNDAEGAAQKWTVRSTGLSLQARQALNILRRPNKQYSGKLLIAAIAVATAIEGNGYAEIVRNGFTTPEELWYLPPGSVDAIADADGYLSHYMVTTKKGRRRVEAADMIHVRNGIDPDNGLLGISDLNSAAREVLGDNKAAEYIAALLINPATGLLVSPSTGSKITVDELGGIVQRLVAKVTGGFRFGTVGSTQPLEISEFGITPDKMPVKETRQSAVERILAVIGIDPMVIGLPSTNKTYSNLSEARRGAYKSLLIPLQGLIAEEFDASFLSQFVTLKDAFWCQFDLSAVQELQEDENARWERIGRAYATYGLLKRGEARAMLGLDAEKADDVYAVEVGAANAGAPDPKAGKAKAHIENRRRVFEAVGIADDDD